MSYKRHAEIQASKDPRKKHRLSAITKMVFEHARKLESGKTSIHTQFGHMHLHMHSAHICTLTYTHNINPGNTEKKIFICHIRSLPFLLRPCPPHMFPTPIFFDTNALLKILKSKLRARNSCNSRCKSTCVLVFFFRYFLLNILSLNIFIIDTIKTIPTFRF